MIRHDSDYIDAGTDYYDRRDQRNREHLARHYQQALTRLGYQVTLAPPGDSGPPPGTDPSTPVSSQTAWPLPQFTGAPNEPASPALPRAG